MKKARHSGVFQDRKRIYTKSLVKGQSVYGERIIKGYREWIPNRSKLGAALRVGLKNFPFTKNSTILYLGCASGTTCSHLSDLCTNGRIFGLDVAFRVFTKFIRLCETRNNLYPVFADAKHPETYKFVDKVDILFQDIAQKDQVHIFVKNCEEYLKTNGYGMLAVKARSIDVTKKPQIIFSQVREELKKHFKILEEKNLKPYEKDHDFFVIKKTGN